MPKTRHIFVRTAWLAATALSVATTVFAQVDPRTALLERAGWDALAAGRARAAADAFREAAAADPRNPRVFFGAAMAAYLDRRAEDAKKLVEASLALDPKATDARALLGQILRRGGALSAAIKVYEDLATDAPDDKNAAVTLDRWRREADLHDRMQQAVGAHFLVAFEGPAEEALAAQALESLDRAYWRVGGVLGVYPADPVPVVLYTKEQFQDITRSPAWAAGAYDGTIRVPVAGAGAKSAEFDRVLAHEFTHALVRSLASRGVPAWLNEGLASALETDDIAWAERRAQTAGGIMPLTLLQNGFGRFTGADAQVAYATSALLVHSLLEEAGGYAVANLLRDLGDGLEFDAAFLHRMQRTIAQFSSTLASNLPSTRRR